jgi:hypothetical protein
MFHKVTKVSIVAEKVLERNIYRILEQQEATGYSIYEGGGNGAFHAHPSAHPPLSDGFKIIKIEAILQSREKAEKIAQSIMEKYLSEQPGIVYLEEVEVVRPQKF